MATKTKWPLATPETTGPGALLTDGTKLFEVSRERRRDLRAGERTLSILERELIDAADDFEGDDELFRSPARWVPMAELRTWAVVRSAAAPLVES